MNEIYLYKKDNSAKETVNIGLAYPSTYYYGMSVLGYLSLFKELDTNPKVNAQRIFLNSKALAFEPKHLDILGFSCIFELDILQILKILKKYGFNPEAKKRTKIMPLIFAGGPVITSNPEPFAEFFDFLIIGDGENTGNEITEVYLKNKNKPKKELLLALSKIRGVYVPSLYNVKYSDENICAFYPKEDNIPRFIEKRTYHSAECLYSPIISENTFYSDTVFIELSRSCPEQCKFCTAHWQNQPCRYYDIQYIKKVIKKASKYAKRIIFIGAMISAHPQFEEICMYIKKLKSKRNFIVEVASMSFEYLSNLLPEILDEKTISLSVECGSEELRYKTGKNLSNEKIEDTITHYSLKGITKFTLYFMIGLPDETKEDIEKYVEFSINLAKKFPDVKFTHIISSFIPKPQTPYEKEKRVVPSILKEYIEYTKEQFDENGIEYTLPAIQNDVFNSLLSLGDRRLTPYILNIFEKNTPLKDMFKEYKKFMKKFNSNKKSEYKLPHYSNYIYKTKNNNQILPWDFIKMK